MPFILDKYCIFICLLAGLTSPTLSIEETDQFPLRVVTGGYEAIEADKANRKIKGPRTSSVKTFLHAKNLSFQIETMLWSRAYNIAINTPDVFIYPLSRTKEREKHFIWIKKIDEHHLTLMSHTSVNANSLNKAQIISGKYFAVCEKNTGNCHMLRDYGFPEANILRVAGVNIEGVVLRLVEGRASFMIENYDIVSEIITRMPKLKGKIETVGNVKVIMEDYLAASRLSSEFTSILKP